MSTITLHRCGKCRACTDRLSWYYVYEPLGCNVHPFGFNANCLACMGDHRPVAYHEWAEQCGQYGGGNNNTIKDDDNHGLTPEDIKHLKVLGLRPDAIYGTIRAAFFIKAKELHPDKGAADSAEFRAVRESYEHLISIPRFMKKKKSVTVEDCKE